MIDYKKLNILVLDDQKIFTNIISSVLVDIGVGSVKIFNDPKMALECLKTYTPNIIISDIEMGEKDGFQFVKEAREDYPATKLAAVILLTSHSEAEFIQQAKGLGVSGYLLKPISPEKIKTILKKIYNSLLAAGRL